MTDVRQQVKEFLDATKKVVHEAKPKTPGHEEYRVEWLLSVSAAGREFQLKVEEVVSAASPDSAQRISNRDAVALLRHLYGVKVSVTGVSVVKVKGS